MTWPMLQLLHVALNVALFALLVQLWRKRPTLSDGTNKEWLFWLMKYGVGLTGAIVNIRLP